MEATAPDRKSSPGPMIFKGILAISLVAGLVVAATYFDLQQLIRQALAWISGLGVVGVHGFVRGDCWQEGCCNKKTGRLKIRKV